MLKQILLLPVLSCCYWTLQAQTDLSDLFAPPTATEIAQVKTDWASRDYNAYDWTVEETAQFQNTFTTVIASHTFEGRRHYGFVRYPADYQATQSYPVLVFNHGGQGGVGIASMGQFSNDCYRSFFIIMPSFRNEELRGAPVFNSDYVSDGPAGEMDGDTDDALRLLSGVIANIAGADANRIGVTGGSRGGGVTHLMSAKDQRIKRTCVFFGATDHITHPGMQERVENHIDNNAPIVPPESTAFNYGAAPYLNGDLTLTQARLALLRRSAIHFIDQMVTPTEIHHGDEDFVVTIEHSERIVNTFANAGQVSPDVTYYEYPGEGHNLNMTQAVDRQRLFLCELTNPSVLAVDDVDIAVHCVSQTNVAQIEWRAQVGYHYQLECSVDGHDWRVLHFTEVDLPKQSKYRHETGAAEHYLYRLRITDDAQQTRYTKTVTSPCASTRATVFTPNPATHQIRINEPVEQFRIYDTDGKKVLEGQQSTLYVGMLSAGVYQFHYRIGERWFAQKLVLLQ